MAPELEGFRPSSQQKRLWRLTGPRSAPLAQAVLAIAGGAPPERLRDALTRLVERHEILRTELRPASGLRFPVQVIHPPSAVAVRWEHLVPAEEAEAASVAAEWWKARREEAAQERKAPSPVHAALLPVRAGGRRLLLSLPALRADRHSFGVLAAELGRACDGDPAQRGDEPLQYADFAAWQGELAEEGGEAAAARTHWRSFETADVAAALPGPSPVVDRAVLPDAAAAAVVPAAGSLGVTPLAWIAAAWGVLLERLGLAAADGADGAPEPLAVAVSGRPLEGLDAMPGPYACAVPLRVPFAAGDPFADVAVAFADALTRAEEWQEYARLERFPPFTAVVEERQGPAGDGDGGAGVGLLAAESDHEPSPLGLLLTRRSGEVGVEVRRRAAAAGPTAERMAGRLAVLVSAAAAKPATAAADLPLLAEDEARRVEEWNRTAADLGPDLPFHRLVERWVERTPEAPAVVAARGALTYRRLGERAAALTARLRSRGVGIGDRVALCGERAADLVVGILATLRAGAAYVPIDPSQPRERSRDMLRDAAPRVLLAAADLAPQLAFQGPVIDLGTVPEDGAAAAPEEGGAEAVSPRHLAYVIFTSGSTGRPKGVAVEHRALVNYVRAVARRLDIGEGWSYGMVSTFAADLGHTSLFTALATGGCVHMVDEARAADPDAFAHYVRRHGIDVLKIVPSHLGALLAAADPASVLPQRRLVLGGEAPPRPLLERLTELAPELAVFNHYGPTEATVGATAGPLLPLPPEAPVPLGTPLANVEVHLLDRRRRPVPLGVAGEIHLGGAGLARGYLGRGAETARRFVPRSGGGGPGSRLYATGDLGRRHEDGRLEFLGRADHQVKVRGYRIEPGEIEAVLDTHPAVRESVVVVRETATGQPHLVAYAAVRHDGAESPDLRRHLAERLPDHMVPARFVELDSLPLTANGKVDRRALPEPSDSGPEVEYVAPRSREEEVLATIWADLLGRERVGVEDNFFDLGGDSILAIRVVARANQEGLRLDPQKIFEHQTVGALATVARDGAGVKAEQGAVTGPVPLLPIQHWFFELPLRRRHHWNQAILLVPLEPLRPVAVARAVRALVDHHDALRARFRRGEGGWRQELAPPAAVPTPFVRVDLGGLPAARWRDALEGAAAALQGSFHLRRGPLFRAALISGGEEQGQRLFLAAHHLVVDGVSWHLLVEDLRAVYVRVVAGGEPRLPAKTTAVKSWAERLVGLAGDPGLRDEADFWRGQRGGGELAADHPEGCDARWAEARITVGLDGDDTEALLHGLRPVLRSEINDVLLAGLASAFAGVTGADALCVMLEGHGRESIADDVDLSRTVGWFTTRFPVLLPAEDDLEATLRAVKERLRQVPRRGLGYGVLRYLGSGVDLGEAPAPQVSFNYLGQIAGGSARSAEVFAFAPEARGDDRHPLDRRPYPLSIDGGLSDGCLTFNLRYGAQRYRRATVERLAEAFRDRLASLAERARSGDEVAASSVDFPLADLDEEGLAALSQALEEVD